MRQIREIIAGKKCVIYADEQPQVLLIQPVGEHEEATLDAEIEAIKEAVNVPFVFAGFAISDWEEELTPWHDPNISPRESVGDHVFETLGFITEQLMPYIFERYGKLPVVLGGYSLAGLFARWAVCKAECFDAVAAASPSLWIVAWKGFLMHMRCMHAMSISVLATARKSRRTKLSRKWAQISAGNMIICNAQ